MNKKYIAFCFSLALLTSCASQALNENLPHLQGKDIYLAIRYLGHPDAETTIAGKKVYIWGHQQSGTYLQTINTPYYGSAYGSAGSLTYQGQTTTVVPQSYNDTCLIKLIANKKGIIEDWQWKGNEDGCSHYMNAMHRIADVVKAVRE
jgi:hypothetical protein